MRVFRQHYPRFIDMGDKEIPSHPFETVEELFDLGVVKRYSVVDNFNRFELSGNYLMRITDYGFGWWVVGHISDVTGLDIPEWKGWKFKAKMDDGTIKILEDEVISSCGDVLTLRDGTTAINTKY